MSTSRRISCLVLAASLVVGLAGCSLMGTVVDQTEAVAGDIEGMPGVLEVTVNARDQQLFTPERSKIWVTIDEAATEDEALAIITVVADANRERRGGGVNTQAELMVDDAAGTERLELDYRDADDEQLAELVSAWFELRQRYEAAGVTLRDRGYEPNPVAYEVKVGMPDDSTVADDLAALRDVSAVFADKGPVTDYFAGRFQASRLLPSESSIALIESIMSTPGIDGASGEFHGDELLAFTLQVSAEAALVDFAIGVSPVIAAAVDQVGADAPPVSLAFSVDSDRAAFFDNASCERYVDLPESDASRALLLHWGRDGRTLLDGSAPASCFA